MPNKILSITVDGNKYDFVTPNVIGIKFEYAYSSLLNMAVGDTVNPTVWSYYGDTFNGPDPINDVTPIASFYKLCDRIKSASDCPTCMIQFAKPTGTKAVQLAVPAGVVGNALFFTLINNTNGEVMGFEMSNAGTASADGAMTITRRA